MKLKEIIGNPQTTLIDVRSTTEYNIEHIPGAINIPLHELQYRISEIDHIKSNPIVLYCRSGNRSGMAVQYLQQQGYANVYNGEGIHDIQYYLN